MNRWSGTREGDRARAIAFHDRLKEMAENMAASNPVSNAAIVAINEELRTRSGYVEIVRSEGGFAERFRYKPRRAPARSDHVSTHGNRPRRDFRVSDQRAISPTTF